MRKKRTIKWMILSFVLMMLLPTQVVWGATQFRSNQSSVKTKLGESFNLTIKGKDISNLYGFEVELSYDDKMIEIVGKPSVKFTEGFSAGPTRASDNKVYFGFVKVGNKPGSTGNIDLTNFTFKAKEKGNHTIVLESVTIVDPNTRYKKYPVRQTITVEVKDKAKEIKLTDTKNHWAEKYIVAMVQNGYMVGYEDNTFRPNNHLSRAEMATLLNNISEGTDKEAVQSVQVTTNSFTDVKGHEWFANYVYKMTGRGLLSGYGNGLFKPQQNITRAESVSLIARMAREDGSYVAPKNIDAILAPFKDAKQVAGWAKEDIAWSIQQKIIMGNDKNKLNMGGNITRAEIAIVLCKVLNLDLDVAVDAK